MRDKYNLWRRIILAVIFLFMILSGFFIYLHITGKKTIERNANYVADAADQTAKRIDDLLLGAENSISAIAIMYEQDMDPEHADVELLDRLAESTVFDYIGYIDAEGIYTDNRRLKADISDRDYVKDGLSGHTGMDMVFNGRVSGEDLVIFYAPLRQNGEVKGLLTGRYRQQQMRDIISSSYFGEPAATYLCLPDGTVIASSVEEKPDNILDTLNENDGADRDAVDILTQALAEGSSASFIYTNSHGSSSACVTKLPHSGWRMLQVFPMQVTNEMLDEAVTSAVIMLLWLVLLSVLYILLLLLESYREKKKLTWEKQQMREIVDSTSRLFSRYILADLENDTYRILSNEEDDPENGLPKQGIYSDLCASWNDRMLDDEAEESNTAYYSADYIREHLTEDIPYLQSQNRILENGVHWMQVSVLCLKRTGGTPVSVLLALQDVTELKEKEQRSRDAMEEAYRSARAANDSKRTFLFDMSHDMRTPMNAIIGLAGLLDRDAEDPERVRTYGRKIGAAGQHLLTLINEVLDMSKIESGKTLLNIAPFYLSELVEELDAVFQPQAQEKRQTLTIRVFDVTQEHLMGDKLRLSEIVSNLLSNAIKYTGEGGHVSMIVQGLDRTTPDYVHLLIEISDDGIGMSQEFVRNIFDPFTRENNSTVSGIQGAGLGMTITKSLVDLMGGTISVESVRGQGSTFRVELELRPADEDDTPAFWKESGISGILILGPDEGICGSIQSLVAGTGVKAGYITDRSRLNEGASGEKYDLILLDRILPGMDAVDSISFIRSSFGTAPLLILIDNDWLALEEEARKAGADSFLPAPFAVSTLRNAVSEGLRRRRTVDRDGYRRLPVRELRFLAAEDNDINAEILAELLDTEGIVCERAENGKEAVEMFQNRPAGYYDAILMDIQMPEMNGYEAAEAIRGLERPDAGAIPIVAMTANAFAEDIRRSLDSGMNAHIAKPVSLEKIKSVLSELLTSSMNDV